MNECGLCRKPVASGGSCQDHIDLFTKIIEEGMGLAELCKLTEDEAVDYIESLITRTLKNEALKYARPGEIFTPESFKVTRVEKPTSSIEIGASGQLAYIQRRDDEKPV